METVLSVRNLRKKFKSVAVDDISFDVKSGNVYGLLGPNGSGKSTTLGMLLTTVNPTSGSWSWFGEDFTSIQTLKSIGAIIEQPNFYPYLSGYKNLQIVCEIKGVNYARIEVVLELVGLIDRKNDLFRTYSLGMKQRLSIASALLNEPKVLILDEPTNGLDPEGIIQIRELIQQVAKSGTTILLASHMLDEVEKICSHVIVLKNGKSLYSGPVQEMSAGAAYFEILAADLVQLQNALKSLDFVQRFEVKSGLVQVFTKDGIDASVLNQSLAEKGVFLSHLNFKQENLESKFLHLVKQ
jgi:ABC-2 type transport system ATP-binding protein